MVLMALLSRWRCITSGGLVSGCLWSSACESDNSSSSVTR